MVLRAAAVGSTTAPSVAAITAAAAAHLVALGELRPDAAELPPEEAAAELYRAAARWSEPILRAAREAS